jgi:hypothetical protein
MTTIGKPGREGDLPIKSMRIEFSHRSKGIV